MADDKRKPAPRKPGEANTEAALGLEVARLFGMSPKLLVKRAAPVTPTADEPEEAGDQEPGDG